MRRSVYERNPRMCGDDSLDSTGPAPLPWQILLVPPTSLADSIGPAHFLGIFSLPVIYFIHACVYHIYHFAQYTDDFCYACDDELN